MKNHSVNYIQHMAGFYGLIAKDDRLFPAHVSLYMALFQFWNLNRFQNPISICRNEMMVISKIGSTNTYTKCLKDLDKYGYIQYLPSFNPLKGSAVNLFNFDKGTSKGTNKGSNKGSDKGSDKGSEKVVRPSINSINKINKINKTNKINIESANSHLPLEQKRNNKKIVFQIPTLSELENFFMESNHSVLEANRFFNHFQSNGWLIGGRSKMKDWKAAARNWMSRSKEYNKAVDTNPLSAEIKKDYSEPL